VRGEHIEDFLDELLGGGVLAGLDELVVSVAELLTERLCGLVELGGAGCGKKKVADTAGDLGGKVESAEVMQDRCEVCERVVDLAGVVALIAELQEVCCRADRSPRLGAHQSWDDLSPKVDFLGPVGNGIEGFETGLELDQRPTWIAVSDQLALDVSSGRNRSAVLTRVAEPFQVAGDARSFF
jgi:hypothetical protein